MTADPPDDANLTARTIVGVRWTYASKLVAAAMQVGFAAVISRLLPPAVFGVLAVAQLAIAFAAYFSRAGLAPALIQRPSISDTEIRGIFTSSVLFGTTVAGLLVLLAPTIAAAVSEPEVIPVLRVMALALVLSALATTSDALLRRNFRFKVTALVGVISYFVGYFIVGLALALNDGGVWSLVIANLTQRGVAFVVLYAVVRHPVRPLLSMRVMRPLYAYGSKKSVSGMIEYLTENLDTFAVTRYLGASAAGQYNRAYVLVSLPLYYLTHGLNDVLFSGFSKLQHQPARLVNALQSAIAFSAGLLLPLCAGIAIAREELVLVVLGPQWDQTAAVLPLIALANAFHFLSGLASSVCEAIDQMSRKLVLEALTLAVLVGLMAIAAGADDVRAYAAALAGAEAIRQTGYVLLLRNALHIRVRSLLASYALAVGAATTTALTIGAARAGLLLIEAPVGVVLGGQILAGAVSLVLNLRFGFLQRVRRDLVDRLRLSGVLDVNRSGFGSTVARQLLGR